MSYTIEFNTFYDILFAYKYFYVKALFPELYILFYITSNVYLRSADVHFSIPAFPYLVCACNTY